MPSTQRDLVAFFGLAFALAWAVFLAAAWVADVAGLSGAVELIARAEALDFEGYRDRLPVPPWAVYLATRIADFAFTLAALAVLLVREGGAGVRRLLARLLPTRRAARVLGVGLLPLAFYALAAAWVVATGAVEPRFDVSAAAFAAALVSPEAGILFAFFLRGAMGEEPGLRGFALVRLEPSLGAVRASLVIGLLWFAWHVPVLLERAPVEIAAFGVLSVLLSFVMTWLFQRGGGCLLPPMLFHAAQNSEEVVERLVPSLVGTDWEMASTLALAVFALGVTVAVVHGERQRAALRP
ncbi:MAG: CPBP family intramembrane glutamic endopeptidase [Myxococcota bacterium]